MKFTKPEYGTTKIVRLFAILPIAIEKETRWLEWVKIRKEYVFDMSSGWEGWLNREFFVEAKTS